MKKQKYIFNQMLIRYNKYLRKLRRLEVTGRNEHRQSVLHRHIERLSKKLNGLYISIKHATAIAAVAGLCMVAAPDAAAQTSFGTVATNPFSLTGIGRSSSPTYVDLDNDGDLDVMVGNYYGSFKYYKNTGTVSAPAFAAVQTNPFSLTKTNYYSAPTFADLDNDGDLDLMSADAGGNFKYYKNTGTVSAPAFAAVQTNSFSLTSIGSRSFPAFADLDNDGDVDLMVGAQDGNFHYFQNTGTVSVPAFAAVQTNPFFLTDIGSRSAPTFADLDNDGDVDVMAGDQTGNFHYFENTGTASAPAFSAVQANPFSLTDIGYWSTPALADLDNDGDLDMMSGNYDGDFYYFENTTPVPLVPSNPFFIAVQTNPFSLVDIGIYSKPALVDLDNDGDLDLISGSLDGKFYYFQNTGTASAPAFATFSINPFSLTDIGGYSTPVFADMDNDGDLDIMVGEQYGNFKYFQNTGTVGAPLFATVQTNPFSLTDIGFKSAPSFVDLDNDGDLDIMTGEQAGNFHYFQNTGTVSAPTFAAVQNSPFSLTDIGLKSIPGFADLDNDGDLDLLAGALGGNQYYFQNTGTVGAPAFAAVENNPFSLAYTSAGSSPTLADLDNDGDLDVMVGEANGIFYYFENVPDNTAPTFTSATAVDYAENGTGVAYSATADEAVTFTLGSSKDESLFGLANANQISFSSSPDFETPLDGNTDNGYVIDVIATDAAGNATTLEVTISVTDLDEIAPTFTSSASADYAENGTGVAYSATADETVTFTLGSSKDESLFGLANANEISFSSSPDFETPLDGTDGVDRDNDYVIDVIATDPTGNSTTLEVTISVTDVDEVAPSFTSNATADFAENGTGVAYSATADETVTFTLGSSKDESLFGLANDSQISFSSSPDYETPTDGNTDNDYVIDVIATDAAGNATTFEVTITVTDVVDETAPSFTSSATADYAENGTGVAYAAIANESVTFTLGSSKDESLFGLANANQISFSSSPDFETPLDGNTDNWYVIDVIATDAAGNATTLEVTITVTDVVDETAPSFISSATADYAENGTGIAYSASADEAVTFTLGSSKDESLFGLANDNEISFSSSPDFETPLDGTDGVDRDNAYKIDVIATDAGGNATTLEVTISVTDVDEIAPTFTSSASASYSENGTAVAYTAGANETVTFTLGTNKDESPVFEIANGNQINFTSPPDYENPFDFYGTSSNNEYIIDIIATDAAGNVTTLEVTITVTDVVDETAPTFTSNATADYAENGTGIAYTAGANETVTFTLGSSKDESLFGLANDNEISFSSSPDFETPLDGTDGVDRDNAYKIDVIATDPTGNATTLVVTISVTDDAAPTFSNLGGTSTYVLGGLEAGFAMIPFLDMDVTVADAELDVAGDYQGASITLTKVGTGSVNDDFRISGDYYQDSGDVVHFSNGAVATYDDATLGTFTVTFSQSGTSKSVVNAIIQGLGYYDKAGPSSQTINYTISDGVGETATGSVLVNTVLPSFTGTTDTDWSKTTNWNGNFVPNNTHNVVIKDVTNNPIITGTISVNNLELQTGATLTVNSGAALAIMGSVTGDGNAIIKRKTNADLGYSIIGSPITAATIESLGADVIYDFDGTDWTVPTGTMTPGKGYFAAFNNAAPEVTFTGTPNSGTINKPVVLGGDNFNIVANPYAAAISRADFITANGSGVIDGNIWIWDDGGSNTGSNRGGDYIAINNVGTTSTVDLGDGIAGSETAIAFNGNIGSVQGFLVLATADADITFTPSMQNTVAGNNDDANHFRTGDLQKMRISLSGNGLYSDILVALADGATEGKDYGLDAEKFAGNDLMSFYSQQGEKHYAIQTLPHVTSEDRMITLGMEVGESATYTLEVQDMENMEGLIVYLNDKQTGEQMAVVAGNTYSFPAKAGAITDRFSLTFSNSVLGNEELSSGLKVFKRALDVVIYYPSNAKEKVSIYTLSGQLVYETSLNFIAGEGVLDVQLDVDQLYILRLNNESVKFILK